MRAACMVLVLALVALGACARVNQVALVASTAAIVCDGAQTYRAAAGDWGHGSLMESNPIMGTAPSKGRVVGYFAGAAIANVAVWLVMPERYKSVAPAGVLAMQVDPIATNVRSTRSVCGFPF